MILGVCHETIPQSTRHHRSGHSKNKIVKAHGYSKDTWLLYKQQIN